MICEDCSWEMLLCLDDDLPADKSLAVECCPECTICYCSFFPVFAQRKVDKYEAEHGVSEGSERTLAFMKEQEAYELARGHMECLR